MFVRSYPLLVSVDLGVHNLLGIPVIDGYHTHAHTYIPWDVMCVCVMCIEVAEFKGDYRTICDYLNVEIRSLI